MTGRGAGYCGGNDMPGYAQLGNRMGLAFRRGFGGGRGWHHRYNATGLPGWQRVIINPAPSQEQDLTWLTQEASQLKEQLDALNRRIDELKKNTED